MKSLATLLVLRGKPYYLAPAYPILFAAGGIHLERFFARRGLPWLRRSYLGLYALSGVALAAIALPVLPIDTLDQILEVLLGRVVPPTALSGHLHGQHGWPEHAAAVERVYRALPAADQQRGDITIAYGLSRPWLERHFAEVREADRVVAPGARKNDTDLPVYECRRPTTSFERMWPELKRYGHFAPAHSVGLPSPRGAIVLRGYLRPNDRAAEPL